MPTYSNISGLDRALANVERQVYEVAHRRGMETATRVVANARAHWPFGTTKRRKRSKYLWRIEDKSNGTDRVHLVINNDAQDAKGNPYAFYIRSAQVPGAGKKNAWLVLVRRPMLKALRELATQTARDPLGRG
jgi:hypothetical protein